MCLSYPKKVQTDNDIICYKRIVEIQKFNFDKVKHGDSFVGRINKNLVDGKISIEHEQYFFCTNSIDCDGLDCVNKLDYEYSWILDEAVSDIVVNDIKLPVKVTYKTPYRSATIEIGKSYTSIINKNGYSIEEALHSYRDVLDARNNKCSNEVIVKCLIPKDSECYLGDFEGKKKFLRF